MLVYNPAAIEQCRVFSEGHEAISPMVVHRNDAERAMTIVLAMLICCRCGSKFASEPHLERR